MQSIEERRAQAGRPHLSDPAGAEAWTRRTRWRPSASAAIPATATRAWCMQNRTPTSTASARSSIYPTWTLMTNSRVTRQCVTNASGTAVTAVEVMHSGAGQALRIGARPQGDGRSRGVERTEPRRPTRPTCFCVCAGAVNSAVILLASANDKHPTGVANRSDQVGRNFMYHQADALLALSTESNEDTYTKTWGTNDFYIKRHRPELPVSAGAGAAGGQLPLRDDEGRCAAADAGLCA